MWRWIWMETVRREARHGVPIYYGDGSNANVLRHMKSKTPKCSVVALSDPFTARRTVKVAKGLNAKLHIVVRTRYCGSWKNCISWGRRRGAGGIREPRSKFCVGTGTCQPAPGIRGAQRPSKSGGKGYALLRRSEMPELAHHLRGGTLTDVEVETCRIDDEAPAVGKSLAELSIRPRTGASVIAWTRSQVTQSNPSEHVRLQASDVITLLGSREQIRRAMALLNEPNHGASHPMS